MLDAQNPIPHSNMAIILTEAFTYGGLETHIESEIRSLRSLGYSSHLVVGKRFSNPHQDLLSANLSLGLPLEPNMSVAQLLECVQYLKCQISTTRPVFLHVHPYLSLIPGLIAALEHQVPVAVTLHGPSALHHTYGTLYAHFLHEVLFSSGLTTCVVSEELRDLIV
ncbi:MAG: glycosyltransferase, partial [Armatimonadota bacterium]